MDIVVNSVKDAIDDRERFIHYKESDILCSECLNNGKKKISVGMFRLNPTYGYYTALCEKCYCKHKINLGNGNGVLFSDTLKYKENLYLGDVEVHFRNTSGFLIDPEIISIIDDSLELQFYGYTC